MDDTVYVVEVDDYLTIRRKLLIVAPDPDSAEQLAVEQVIRECVLDLDGRALVAPNEVVTPRRARLPYPRILPGACVIVQSVQLQEGQ